MRTQGVENALWGSPSIKDRASFLKYFSLKGEYAYAVIYKTPEILSSGALLLTKTRKL